MHSCIFCGKNKPAKHFRSNCPHCQQKGAYIELSNDAYYRNANTYQALPKSLPEAQPEFSAKIRPQKSEKFFRESDLRKPEPKIIQANKTPILGLDTEQPVKKFEPPKENFLSYNGSKNAAAKYTPKPPKI